MLRFLCICLPLMAAIEGARPAAAQPPGVVVDAGSVEEAGRRLRYEFLAGAARERVAEGAAAAHGLLRLDVGRLHRGDERAGRHGAKVARTHLRDGFELPAEMGGIPKPPSEPDLEDVRIVAGRICKVTLATRKPLLANELPCSHAAAFKQPVQIAQGNLVG